jgi:hypothetical protein
MVLTDEQWELLMICGRFNFPLSKCLVQLSIPEHQADEFTSHFNDHFSDIRQAYEMGAIKTEFDIMSALEDKVHGGGEGADEAAKALGSMRRYQKINEQLNEMYGL